VKKIHSYITKKVAGRLEEWFKKDRKAYEEKWEKLEVFVKYGLLTEEKFRDKAKAIVLLKNVIGTYYTLSEYQEKVKKNQTDKEGYQVWLYTSNPRQQEVYVQACKRKDYDVLWFDNLIDQHFLQLLERELEKVRLKRVDAAVIDQLIDKEIVEKSKLSEEQQQTLKSIYEQAYKKEEIEWKMAPLSETALPVVIIIPEAIQRLQAMSPTEQKFPIQAIINTNHRLSEKILRTKSVTTQQEIAQQSYALGLLSRQELAGSALTDFINRSIELME